MPMGVSMQDHSFRHPAAASVFLASALGLVVPAAAQPPTPVSPGDAEGGAVVQSRCPTFSWTGIEGVRGYELALYRLVEEAGAEGATEAEPELLAQVRLPAGSTGWTPSLGRCPERGGTYAWSIRALESARAGEWSEASLFEVSDVPSASEVEAAVETLRRYLRAEGGTEGRREPENSGAEDAPPAPSSTDSARGGGSTDQRAEGRRAAPLRRLVSLADEAAPSSKAAPSLSSPSLTLDSDIALGAGSDFFKDGEVFLWNDSSANTALGEKALASASLVSHSTAVGNRALTNTFNNSTFSNKGSFNVAVGSLALFDNTFGLGNTAVGALALDENTTGDNNTAIGRGALGGVTTGERNIALGSGAGSSLGLGDTSTSLSRNIYIGNNGENDEANTIRIGNGFSHDRTFIEGIEGTSLGSTGAEAVQIDSSGQLGTSSCGSYRPATFCPVGTDSPDGPKCSRVPPGSFCESDGECGTNAGLDNCGGADWFLRVD